MRKFLTNLGLTPTWDADLWKEKWSTKLSALQVSFSSLLLIWAALDADMRASLPTWVPTVIGAGMLILGFLLPPVVNTAQRKLPNPPEET